ncbi:MAG TPA: hypothetical protein VGN52_22235 [Burkholderiales bacterium]|jgi:uncharacterized protein
MKAFCAGLVLLAAAGSAHALSVDCNKIANPDENTICSEVSLAKLDHDLDNAYKLMQAHLPLKMRDYVKNAQLRWRVGPDSPSSGSCKGDIKCIAGKYESRIAFLGNPGLAYEGVYAGAKVKFAVESMPDGTVRVNFFPAAGAPQIENVGEALHMKVADNALTLPPPAPECAARIIFNDNGARFELKEAKKKACNAVRSYAGLYARDYKLIPGDAR